MNESSCEVISIALAAELLNVPISVVITMIRTGLLETIRDNHLDRSDVEHRAITLRRMAHGRSGNAVAVLNQMCDQQDAGQPLSSNKDISQD